MLTAVTVTSGCECKAMRITQTTRERKMPQRLCKSSHGSLKAKAWSCLCKAGCRATKRRPRAIQGAEAHNTLCNYCAEQSAVKQEATLPSSLDHNLGCKQGCLVNIHLLTTTFSALNEGGDVFTATTATSSLVSYPLSSSPRSQLIPHCISR